MKRFHIHLIRAFLIIIVTLVVLSVVLLKQGVDDQNTATAAGSLSFGTSIGSFVDRDAYNNSYFGQGLGVGDINCDGYDDLLVAAQQYNSSAGRLYGFYGGATLDTTSDLVIEGEGANNFFSTSVGSIIPVEDIDSDGCCDVIVGATGINASAGRAYLVFGSTGLSGDKSASLYTFTDGNGSTKKYLGYHSSVGDVNGDGNLDVLSVALHSTQAIPNGGAVVIYYGDGDNTVDTTEDKILAPADAGIFFGYGGLSVGDVNADGYSDVIAGGLLGAAKVYMWYGASDMNTDVDVKFLPENITDYLGWGAMDVSDINEDGYGDVCIGASKATHGGNSQAGRVYCFFGSDSLSGDKNVGTDADIIFGGEAVNDNFGRTIDLTDINNDGNVDLVVGAYQTDAVSKDGYVRVFLGDGSTIETTSDISIPAPETDELFANWLTTGDLDDDGWIDLFVTQAEGGNDGGGGGTTGRVYLYEIEHGDPAVTPTDPGIVGATPDVSGTAADTGGGYTIAGVQWSFGSETTSTWEDCTANDGTFNTSSEPYSCNIHGSDLAEGAYTVYFRTVDNNLLYMSPKLYGSTTFTVDATDPTVTADATEDSYAEGDDVVIEGTAEDDTSTIANVEYSVDGGDWNDATPDDGAFDEQSEDFTITLTGLVAGEYTVTIRVTDSVGNVLSEYDVVVTVVAGLTETGGTISSGIFVGAIFLFAGLGYLFKSFNVKAFRYHN